MQDCILRMQQIRKEFGPVVANDGIDIDIRRGEVHALLGENGAGKSTLMNILSGVYRPDQGLINLNGRNLSFGSPLDAISAGIGMIYQHFKLVGSMSAWENICAGPRGDRIIRPRRIKRRIEELCAETGLQIDLDRRVDEMGVGEKQTLEIIKVLYRGAELLILDEPTAVLTPQEAERLFAIVRGLRDSGRTAIIITHKLQEVMEISDRVTVLRKGSKVGTVETADTSRQLLAELMVGRRMELHYPRSSAEIGEPILTVRDLTVEDIERRRLGNISFELRRGEILAVAGVTGSGQTELCEVLTGLRRAAEGRVELDGKDISGLSAWQIRTAGIDTLGFVPEDRLGMGLIRTMSMAENLLLRSYRHTQGIFLDLNDARDRSSALTDALDIMHPGLDKPIRAMSGGNLQKILIGREIARRPEVLIAAYPVRGLDLGVTFKVIDLLNREKERGVGVLMIAEDLDLMLEVADRILVLHCGVVSGLVDAQRVGKHELGLMMASPEGACIDA